MDPQGAPAHAAAKSKRAASPRNQPCSPDKRSAIRGSASAHGVPDTADEARMRVAIL
jgi:hypothetical protein